MPSPLVSIVITAYNDEATLAAAIESAIAQTHTPREIIIVLDGPTDRTPWIAEGYRNAVDQVVQKENGGTASARNAGHEAARGEWIQYLDADDVLAPDKIEASLAALGRAPNRHDVAIVYTGYHRVDATGQITATHYAADYSRQKLLTVPGHVTPNPLIRAAPLREVGGFSDEYRYAEDTELYHRLGLIHPMLGVPEPHFFYRSLPTQKTQVMRNHERGNLILQEPRKIHETYARAFERTSPPWMHPVGQLAERGVLDVGLKCTHSCKFCYYSFLDGSDDQFAGMRRASFRPTEECEKILRGFAEGGLTHFDVTGGEPTLHKDIVDVIGYAYRELGLRARIITLGQFLMRALKKGRKPLIEELLDAGLDDFLMSVHAVDEEMFKDITGESFAKLAAAMDFLDARDFSYCTNTLVYQRNFRHLPEIAEHLASRNVRIANFIVMNTYHNWNQEGRVLGVQARYREIRPYLDHAIQILDDAGVGVNIRYGPYCAYKGMEKHFVGVLGVELDPYEWRSTLRTGQIKQYRDGQHYLQVQRKQLDDPGSMYTKVKGAACQGCQLRLICDGVDAKYVAQYGWSEFRPYPTGPAAETIRSAVHFRADNPRAFTLKNEGPTRVAAQGATSAADLLLINGEWSPETAARLDDGRVDDAVAGLEQAVRERADDAGGYHELARMYHARGQHDEIPGLEERLRARPAVSSSAVLRFRGEARLGVVARLPSAVTAL